jgi:predicted short-subunit dehydrogenase-like oxidoreductase (DUF2520 family)
LFKFSTLKNTNSFLKNRRIARFQYLRCMVSVTLIGGGNLAQHLATAFFAADGIELRQIYNRSIASIAHWEGKVLVTNRLESLVQSEVCIIAVNDQSIEDFSKKLAPFNGLLLHCSGNLDLDVLCANSRTGVLYPLQSFSKHKKTDFGKIPLCLEASNIADHTKLEFVANCLSKKITWMDTSQRKKLHLAAVFVNNFVNYMYTLGEEICIENGIPFEILHPLIEETAQKINTLPPSQAQTGPAIRKDTLTLEAHKKQLQHRKKEIYSLLTAALLNTQK